MKIKTSVAVVFASIAAFAANYELDDALSSSDTYLDWTSLSSYKGEPASLPGPGDIVEIPRGMTVKMLAGSASWELMNTLARVAPRSGSTFIIEVSADVTAKALVPITEYGMEGSNDSATLVKRGGGILQFCSYAKVKDSETSSVYYDYYLNIDIEEGRLRLYADGTNSNESYVNRRVNVLENGILEICKVGRTRLTRLNGNGLVTLDNTNEQRIYLVGNTEYSVFDGYMTGPIRFDITKGRHDFTCPTNSINTICISGDVACGFTSMGVNDGAVSSLGTGNFNCSGPSGIIYVGKTGDVTGKPIWAGANTFIDGGEYGGLVLQDSIDFPGSSMRVLRLKGNHLNACEIRGNIPYTGTDKTNVVTVNKTGTGTWSLLGDKNRSGLGVIEVENGTLRYDSIAEKGYPCSLGYSTNLYQALTTGKLEDVADKKVDYSFLLGGEGTMGTMEYIGTTPGCCRSRLMAVRSSGRFVSDVSPYWLEDVYAYGTGEKTLVLSGSSNLANAASKLSDGNDGGKLNVIKEGPGTWSLAGSTSFTGELLVTGGVLKVENDTKYKWYRMNFTENGYGSDRYDTEYSYGANSDRTPKKSNTENVTIQILEWAMYDAEGNNLLSNFTTGEPGSIAQYNYDDNYRAQAEKSAVLATKGTYYFNKGSDAQYTNNGFLKNLFDNGGSKIHTYMGTGNSKGITIDNPESWWSIVVRLPDDAPVPTRLDFYSALSTNSADTTAAEIKAVYNGRVLTAYRLDGSVDGVNWDIGISQENAMIAPEKGSRWYSNFESGIPSKGKRDPGEGFEITKTKPDSVPSHSFSTIGVANGGVLEVIGDPIEVSGLVVDASASAGTISNFKFAASGTVDVRNADLAGADSLELPGDYSNLAGFSNLGNWELTFDGDRHASLVLSAANGKLTVRKRGLRVIFR